MLVLICSFLSLQAMLVLRQLTTSLVALPLSTWPAGANIVVVVVVVIIIVLLLLL